MHWALVSCILYFCSRGALPFATQDSNFHVSPTLENQVLYGSIEDPVTSIVIVYPQNEAIEKPPAKLSTVINIRPGGADAFKVLYENMSVCFDMNNSSFGCFRVDENWSELQQQNLGVYTVQAYFSQIDREGVAIGPKYWLSTPTTFTVVDEAQFALHVNSFMEEKQRKYRAGYDLSLIDWAMEQQRVRNEKLLNKLQQNRVGLHPTAIGGGFVEQGQDLVLVIGVKTAVSTNFALRQAIRETWASEEVLPDSVKVFFVGCRPCSAGDEDLDANTSTNEGSYTRRRQLRQAIELEKMVYGDLLTDELDCNDAYIDLASKTKEFLHFAATQYPHARLVMLADDDVYIRADKLAQHFFRLGPQKRFYSGQVPSIQHARKDRPTRDPSKRYSLSVKQYPLSEIPPMAMGAYFFLSMDCAKFVSKNRHRLRDLGGADDITIPLWMLAIQVHVQHFKGLGYLRSEPCDDKFIAFGDLSPLAIREIHSNILERHFFCHGFQQHMWLKSTNHAPSNGFSRLLPKFAEPLQFEFKITNARKLGPLQITTVISTPSQAGVKLSYYPSSETLISYSFRMCAEIRLRISNAMTQISCQDFAFQLRKKLQTFYGQISVSKEVESSRLALWEHNLFVEDQTVAPLVVGYSQGVSYSSIMFESLFASMLLLKPILAVDEASVYRRFEGHADIFLLSILDGGCKNGMKPNCRQMIAAHIDRYCCSAIHGSSDARVPCRVIMFSGERHSVDGLDDRVLLLSSVSNVPRRKHIYLSMASASFAERIDHDPTALLKPHGQNMSRKFCAYMYARCGRLERELMFDLLNDVEPVDALGKCAGRTHLFTTRGERPHRYNDDAVERYKNYKFVIAFENSQAPGYVTEKIVNAFLAGSVPIYYGNSTTVSQLFNPKSFIDCGAFSSLRACSQYVLQVHASPEVYSRMLQEPPITNVQAFERAFSWHPAVSSNFLAEELKAYLW